MKPSLVIDSREQRPLEFANLQSVGGTLYSGDISILGMEHLVSWERKELNDLVQSVTRGRDRFERELHRLRGYHFRRVVIEGTEDAIMNHRYRSKASPKSILHSVYALECRFNIPFIWAGSRENAARIIERHAYWLHRDAMKLAEAMTKHAEAV
ncbi:MAG: ERCC4 domain-containing protein [Verrucomicrobia bacterium]|nr:ERCC4 domain-containing protein [Verrucomicrobiota bacterium]